MSRYTIEGETLTGIADAVRSITGGETLLTPAQIEEEIEGTAATMQEDISDLKTAFSDLATATASDVGKALSPKTVASGKVTEWQYKEVGGGGGTSDYTDLTNKPSINNVTLSGNKTASDLGLGTYNKPSGGIPASDLASGVQASLGKADTAYQKPSGGIPSTDIANGVIPDITDKLDKPSTAGTNGQVLTSDGQGGQTWEDPTDAVEDVQINGTSVVSQGVAEIPIANVASKLGLVKVEGSGVAVQSDGKIVIQRATDAEIKNGTNGYKPITPLTQNQSAFYALAKAAGDSTQSASSNAVGTYTNEAKIAIQKMLGIYEAPWELIREDTFTNAEEANHVITVDSNGEPFELTDIAIMFETPTQQTDSAKGQYGQIWFYYGNNSYYASESGAWTQAAGTPAHGFSAILEQKGRLMVLSFSNNTTSSNRGAVHFRYGVGMKSSSQGVQYLDEQKTFTKVSIPKVTGTGHYILVGKRKWN